MKVRQSLTIAGCFALSVPSSAQETGGWLIQTGAPVSPKNPTTFVEVWAWFDDPSGFRDAFARGNFDFVASDGAFREPEVRIAATWGSSVPGGDPGQVRGSRVDGVGVGQLWGAGGRLADTSNPILVWSAEWGTHDFTPRPVALQTDSTWTFQVGTNSSHLGMNVLELYPSGFQPGYGVIQVIPAPSAAATLASLILLGTWHRRR